MADILSPTGIEKPIGGEQHSRAMVNRNYDRVNDIAISERKKAAGVIAQFPDATNSPGLGGTEVVGNLVGTALVAGRWYEIVYELNIVCVDAANLGIGVFFKKSITSDTTIAGTTVADPVVVYSSPSAGSGITKNVRRIFKASTTEAINAKATLQRLVGAHTYDISARRLYLIDLGEQI